MISQNVCTLFTRYRDAVKNLHKISVAYTYLHKTKGTKLVKKARKYKKPEVLENKLYEGVGPRQKFEQVYESLKMRGFGKELPSYNPPSDLRDQLHKLSKKIFGSQLSSDWTSQPLTDRVLKFKFLAEAIKQFDKDIPSADLHKMKEVSDVYEYFSTPVDGALHYDSLTQNKAKLPPNLQVLPEAPRFNPATDTYFDGVTAFPGRKRIIFTKSGDKYEKTIEWPHI